ncbi:signal recognition particle subunit Srp72 [Schizosaccharomyces japonicus yFS275]|uniref:Signal recognition particle subunit SRP72 n=1 Tax=Schizosaccharomyces japonicus (strain yFS275 / FY16936) TaxID=402676 RepID=B6JZ18_SCHJY|nr:signal recognition particle subunit Srp72 [Schizosaccharomyces japonicus yFS275]EEB06786.1 signal recognition particle subunit Srp72 [Schizosaccharomyces japonicus yFS275]
MSVDEELSDVEKIVERLDGLNFGTTPKDAYDTVLKLIEEEKYKEALYSINKRFGPQDALYERAYCCYQLGKDFSFIEDQDFLDHLRAQKSYKESDFTKTLQIYDDMIRRLPSQVSDIAVNMLAAASQVDCWKLPFETNEEDHDFMYNVATRYLNLRQWDNAIELLQANIDRLKELGQDNKASIYPFLLQLMYAFLQKGETEKALQTAKEIEDESVLSTVEKVLFANNLISIDIGNPYLSYKNMHKNSVTKCFSSLLASQSVQLTRNLALLDMAVNKHRAVRSTSKKNIADSAFFETLLHKFSLRYTDPKKIIDTLIRSSMQHPTDIGLTLILVQHYISFENYKRAYAVLRRLFSALEAANSLDKRYAPGLVGLGDALEARIHRNNPHYTHLHAAARYWASQPNCEAKLLLCPRELLVCVDEKASPEVIQQGLLTLNDLIAWRGPASELVACQLAAQSHLRMSVAPSLQQHLLPIKDLLSGTDIDAIENKGVPVAGIKRAAVNVVASTNTEAKKIRKRKKPVPKNFKPNAKPDPERWIPKKDRRNVKLKTKSRNTQGSVAY